MTPTPGIEPVSREEGPVRPATQLHPALGVFLCVAGSLSTLVTPAIGCALMVFAIWRLAHGQRNLAWLAALGCIVPMAVVCVITWDYGSLIVPCVACALAVALLLPGRITITSVCLVMTVLTGLLVLADASLVMLWGESFAAYVNALLEEFRVIMTAQLGESSSPVAVQAAVDEALGLMEKVWPLMYAARALGITMLGLLGLAVARHDAPARIYAAFLRYDVPLWGVVALLVALVAILVGATQVSWAGVAQMVGINLLMVLRGLFFLQGLAVALCAMDRRKLGGLSRIAILTLAFMAELGLCAVCVFGVIDVWANLRRLARGKAAQVSPSVRDA